MMVNTNTSVLCVLLLLAHGAEIPDDAATKLANADELAFSLPVPLGNTGLGRHPTTINADPGAPERGSEGHGLMQTSRGFIPKPGHSCWSQVATIIVFAILCLAGARGANATALSNKDREHSWLSASLLGLQRSVRVRKKHLKEDEEDAPDGHVGPMLLQESMVSESVDAPMPAASLLGLQRSVRVQKTHLKEEGAEEETTANADPKLLQKSMASESVTAPLRASSVLGLQRSVRVQKRHLKEGAEEETTANVGPTLLQESMSSESADAALRASSVLGLQRSIRVQKRHLKEGAQEETTANVGPMLLQESMVSKSADVPLSDYSVLGLQRSVRRQKVHLKEDADDGTDAQAAPMFLQESDSMDAPLPSSSILGLQRSVGVRKTAAGDDVLGKETGVTDAYPDPVLLQESMVGAAVLGLQRRTTL
jgi:hypothetical protein